MEQERSRRVASWFGGPVGAVDDRDVDDSASAGLPGLARITAQTTTRAMLARTPSDSLVCEGVELPWVRAAKPQVGSRPASIARPPPRAAFQAGVSGRLDFHAQPGQAGQPRCRRFYRGGSPERSVRTGLYKPVMKGRPGKLALVCSSSVVILPPKFLHCGLCRAGRLPAPRPASGNSVQQTRLGSYAKG